MKTLMNTDIMPIGEKVDVRERLVASMQGG